MSPRIQLGFLILVCLFPVGCAVPGAAKGTVASVSVTVPLSEDSGDPDLSSTNSAPALLKR